MDTEQWLDGFADPQMKFVVFKTDEVEPLSEKIQQKSALEGPWSSYKRYQCTRRV